MYPSNKNDAIELRPDNLCSQAKFISCISYLLLCHWVQQGTLWAFLRLLLGEGLFRIGWYLLLYQLLQQGTLMFFGWGWNFSNKPDVVESYSTVVEVGGSPTKSDKKTSVELLPMWWWGQAMGVENHATYISDYIYWRYVKYLFVYSKRKEKAWRLSRFKQAKVFSALKSFQNRRSVLRKKLLLIFCFQSPRF